MKCGSCAAPLPDGKARCQYCGTLVNVDLVGTHPDPTKQPDNPRRCCACGQRMETLNLRDEDTPFLIERCPECLGIFLDPGEIDVIIGDKLGQVTTIDRNALMALQDFKNATTVIYRRCPDCQKSMNRVNYGGGSGVIVDSCKAHGLYLDAGELRRILAWVGAGGRLAAAEAAATKAPQPFVADLRGVHEEDLDTADSLDLAQLGRFLSRVFK